MSIFREFFKTQSDQNIHQNALNCTKSLKFLGELAYSPEQLRGAKLGKIQGGCRFDKGGVTNFF